MESGEHVRLPERPNQELIVTSMGMKGCLLDILSMNMDPVIARSKIHLGEYLCIKEFIKQLLNGVGLEAALDSPQRSAMSHLSSSPTELEKSNVLFLAK